MMKINLLKIFSWYLLFFMLVACQNNEMRENSHAEEDVKDHSVVTLNEEQFKTANLRFGIPEKKLVREFVKASGTMELPPQNKASVSSFIGGIISKIFVIPGQFVKENETLATLEHADIIQLQEDYIKAKSSYAFVEKNMAREKLLMKEKVIAEKKFQQVEAEYYSSLATVKSLENKLTLLNLSPTRIIEGHIVKSIPIKSPISGYVHLIEVNTGTFVDPSKEIFRILDNRHIHLDLHVFEKDISKIKDGQTVLFSLNGSEKDSAMVATIFAVGKAFDPETKSVGVHADIKGDKKNHLIPGMYVQAQIIVGTKQAMVIPSEAVFVENEISYIFIYNGKINNLHSFQKIEIQTGISDLGYKEVITPTSDSLKQIVTKGSYFLQSHSRKDELEEGGH